MTDREREREREREQVQGATRVRAGEVRRRRAGVVAFVAGLAVTLAFFAFFPGLPHVIDWGAIVIALVVGALARWACQAWMVKRSGESA